MGVITI